MTQLYYKAIAKQTVSTWLAYWLRVAAIKQGFVTIGKDGIAIEEAVSETGGVWPPISVPRVMRVWPEES
ncbi:MAG TPA: hypothetical protein VE988_16805, partial [Gemmataceae bacterium]|nr:hypothetical protein [Gemmataceae bacterium]